MKPDIETFVKNLNLSYSGELNNNGDYVIHLNSSDEFSNAYNEISTNKLLSVGDDSVSTIESARFIFFDTYYEILLAANFDNDKYTITISER